jgi:hypothetical protein
MQKRVGVVVAALVAATALSGCWGLREAFWTKDKLQPREKTTLRVGLIPSGAGEPGRFFLGLLLKNAGMSFGPAKFDATGELGRPKKMVRDSELAQALGDFGSCDGPFPLPGTPNILFRTRGNVSSDTRKFVDATMRARAAGGRQGGGAGGFVVTGNWVDDGDGVPEDPDTTDDVLECTGLSTTVVIKRGSKITRALRDLAPDG